MLSVDEEARKLPVFGAGVGMNLDMDMDGKGLDFVWIRNLVLGWVIECLFFCLVSCMSGKVTGVV